MKRCEDMGYQFKIGYELEYFLVRKTEDGGIEVADQLDDLEQPCYDIRALTRSFDFVAEVVKNVNSLGWGLYATDHEDANGQFEQNWGPGRPAHQLATARSSTATWSRRWRRSAA